MNALLERIRLLRRYWKLVTFIGLAALLMVPLVFQSSWIGSVSSRAIDRQYGDSIAKQTKSFGLILDLYMNQLEDFSRSLSADDRLAKMLERPDRTEGGMADTINVLSSQYHMRLPVYIHVLTNRGEVYSSLPTNYGEEENLRRIVRSLRWMPTNIGFDPNVLYRDFAPDYHLPLVPGNQLYVTKNIVSEGKPLGLLIIQMNRTLIERLMQQLQISAETTVFLMDEAGKLLVADEYNRYPLDATAMKANALIRSSSGESGGLHVRWRGGTYVFFYQVMPEMSWRIVTLTPSRLLFEDTNMIRSMTTALIVCSVLIAAVLFFLLLRKITLPLLQLSKLVRNVQRGQFEQRFQYRGLHEIEVLSMGIHAMLDRIESQIETIRREEALRRKLEIDRLQTQIRPHFVQNALISLRWLAEDQNDQPLVEALISLTQMLEYSFRQPDAIHAPLQEELAYIRHYVKLQEAILCHPIRLVVLADDDCTAVPVPKLTLQPLVENAIFHGFKGWEGRDWVLTISAWLQNGRLTMSVADNGRGMAPDEADRLSRMIEDGGGTRIGLSNVVRRLRLNTGPALQFRLWSEPGSGMIFALDIPISERGETVW